MSTTGSTADCYNVVDFSKIIIIGACEGNIVYSPKSDLFSAFVAPVSYIRDHVSMLKSMSVRKHFQTQLSYYQSQALLKILVD